ncbi:MAG: HAD family hydrolase [Monoglobales bacterium]
MNKILTFDCYGTLLDTAPLYEHIADHAAKYGLSPYKAVQIFSCYEDRLMYGEDFKPYDQLLREILDYCDMELSTDIFSSEFDRIFDIHRSFLPFEDVMSTLYILKEKGYELALMSNTTKQIMNWHLERFDYIFDDILLADETECYKPSLEFFRAAEQKFELHLKDHYHIAKGYWWDIVPAHKMGWKKIWVNRAKLVKGRDKEKPYRTIVSLYELERLL